MKGADAGKSDAIIGFIILAFCAFAAWRTALINIPPSNTVAGPSFVPWIAISGLAILALAMIARTASSLYHGRSGDRIEFADRATLIRMALLALVMIAYAAAFMRVGYVMSTAVAFVLGLLLLGERRPIILVLVPAVTTMTVYFAFTRLLNVWLP